MALKVELSRLVRATVDWEGVFAPVDADFDHGVARVCDLGSESNA